MPDSARAFRDVHAALDVRHRAVKALEAEREEALKALQELQAEVGSLQNTGSPSWVGSSGIGSSGVFNPNKTIIGDPQPGARFGDRYPTFTDRDRTVDPSRVQFEFDRSMRCAHSLDPTVVTYVDGVIVSHCLRCHERFEIPWWPGGTSATRVEAVVAEAVDGEGSVEELLRISEQVDADLEALSSAAEKLAIARQVIAARLTDADAATGP